MIHSLPPILSFPIHNFSIISNQMLSVLKKVKGHGSDFSDDLGEIYKMVLWQDRIVTLALDSFLKIWDHDLNPIACHPLIEYYILALAVHGKQLLTGNGNGEVKIFTQKLEPVKTIKICGDVISDIKVYGNSLAAVSYDGTVAVVDLATDERRIIRVEGQLFDVCKHGGSFYVSGSRSYRIDEDLTHFEEIERANQFIVVDDELYGISDRRGVFIANGNFSTYSPCDVICPMGSRIVGAFDDGISLFTATPVHSDLAWKTQKVPDFKPGYPLRAIVPLNAHEFVVGGDNGVLYKLRLHG